MEPLFLDIETTTQDPEPWMVPNVEDLQPPATYKKAESIAEWRAEKAATLVDDLRTASSLEPLLGGTVVVVAVARGAGTPAVLVAPSADEAGELDLLSKLEKALAKYSQNPLVTWNGTGFDQPFLAKRAIRHGLYSLAARMHQEKPWSKNHFDLFKLWQQHDRAAKGKLSAVAQFFGIPADAYEITGKDVAAAIAAGDTSKVVQHCAADVERLRAVYWRMRAASWVQGEDTIPDELPVRPPRVSERQRILEACADLQVDMYGGDVQTCAEQAGIPWAGVGQPPLGGPQITDDTPLGQLRLFLAALQARRAA